MYENLFALIGKTEEEIDQKIAEAFHLIFEDEEERFYFENENGTAYNLVGFQTNLKFPEQKRVFSMIPALKNAEFLRYGVMHRNTFINSPKVLSNDYSLKQYGNVFFAGQITGVEGYMESTASGLLAGMFLAKKILGESIAFLPKTTIMGAITSYITTADAENFQPMNANFGIIAPFDKKIKGGKKCRNEAYAERSLGIIASDFAFFKNK